MISLEKAVALKEAGLRWEPKEGNWYYCTYTEHVLNYDKESGLWQTSRASVRLLAVTGDLEAEREKREAERERREIENVTFVPRLDQLLAEIERRGWIYNLRPTRIELQPYPELRQGDYKTVFVGKPEDAAAEALLWILEQEAVTLGS